MYCYKRQLWEFQSFESETVFFPVLYYRRWDVPSFDFESVLFSSSNCLVDQGDYFNKAEWNKHVKSLPGERYTLNQQCELILGEGYTYCEV